MNDEPEVPVAELAECPAEFFTGLRSFWCELAPGHDGSHIATYECYHAGRYCTETVTW